MKLLNYVVAVGTMTLAIGCAHQSEVGEHRSSGLVSDVRNEAQARTAIENWDHRITALKKDATDVATETRFNFLNKKISKLDEELSGVREDFLRLRLATAADRQKYINAINRNFNEMSEAYRKAE